MTTINRAALRKMKSRLKTATRKSLRSPSTLEETFLKVWSGPEFPTLEREYQFARPRRWRFDFAHSVAMVAIEIEGGVWSHGRHTRPAGFIADMEKYNAAALMGWRVFRLHDPSKQKDTIRQIAAIITTIGELE